MDYPDVSLGTKIGGYYLSPNGRLRIGLKMNSPNLDAYGSGDVKKEFYSSNVHDDSQGDFPSDLAFAEFKKA